MQCFIFIDIECCQCINIQQHCIDWKCSSIKKLMLSLVLNIKMSKNFLAGSLFCIGVMFGSLSAVFLMDAIGRKASLLAFSVMSLFIGWTLLMAASQAII